MLGCGFVLQSDADCVCVVGYGLSYVNFSYAHVDATAMKETGGITTVSLAMLPRLLRSQQHGFVPAAVLTTYEPAGRFSINVTNMGDLAADDVVLGFLTPPQAGQMPRTRSTSWMTDST